MLASFSPAFLCGVVGLAAGSTKKNEKVSMTSREVAKQKTRFPILILSPSFGCNNATRSHEILFYFACFRALGHLFVLSVYLTGIQIIYSQFQNK